MFSRLQSLKAIIELGIKEELPAELEGLVMENGGTIGLEELIECLETKRQRDCIEKINELLSMNQPPVKQEDIDLSGLRTQWTLYQTRLSVLNYRKQELLRRVNDFRLRHNQQLGSIMARMLFLRKELLFLALKENAAKEEEYNEADADYTNYQSERARQPAKQSKQISEKDQRALSNLYRKASKRCHPDIVSEELREEAEAIFARLNEAYVNSDLDEVKKINSLLEEGGLKLAGKDEGVKEGDRLKLKIERVKKDIDSLLREITNIEESPAYQTVISQKDLDAYFERLKAKLDKELLSLEKEYAEKTGATAV